MCGIFALDDSCGIRNGLVKCNRNIRERQPNQFRAVLYETLNTAVSCDMTGKYSAYTIYEGHEIMFHVSTLLPYSKDNRQQVERKRHIGNDIVNIIFLEGTHLDHVNFKPTMIKSQFTRILF
ncbi:hypothetical protein CEXT_71481 [Caerostris extrusa]|uniref:Rap-GAP domain-containing protein n=1 Tax=Caerostris extrusa TaxID=172846 RepID=A0AAV4UW45_CAEEX|nr:hypothetical protein CEXT_71481 [Caerostris extrusa]